MAYVKKQIGETTVTRVKVEICKACGCWISDTGLCDYDCKLDGNPRTPQQVATRVYERTEVLVEEREGM